MQSGHGLDREVDPAEVTDRHGRTLRYSRGAPDFQALDLQLLVPALCGL